jgi:hypothetical protein
MNDVVLAALFSTAGAAIVAVAGAIATIFGPAWRERAQRRDDRNAATAAARYDGVLEFVEALGRATAINPTWEKRRMAHVAWSRFVATLRPGEGYASEFSRLLLHLSLGKGMNGQKFVDTSADLLFGWLRGDRRLGDLEDAMDEMRRESREFAREAGNSASN